MATLAELARQHTALSRDETAHLQHLVSEWGLLADLSFADLLLYVPAGEGRWLVTAHVRPSTGQTIYLSHVTASWTAPTAYYEQITVNAEGYQNYAVVWDYAQRNSVRNETGSIAMFNQGLIVLIPAGTVMDIKIHNFYNNRKGGGRARNVEDTTFTVELWAAPDRYLPITIPPLP